GAPVRRRDGDRTSRAERAGESVPVEGHPGQDPAGGAPHPHLPPGASTGDSGPLSPRGRRRRAGGGAHGEGEGKNPLSANGLGDAISPGATRPAPDSSLCRGSTL